MGPVRAPILIVSSWSVLQVDVSLLGTLHIYIYIWKNN